MIKNDDHVIAVKDGQVCRGTVKNVYERLNVAIVDFGEGLEKVSLDRLALDREAVAQGEPKRKRVEKSEITITPDEFEDIAIDVVAELAKDQPILGVAFTMFSAKLARALFTDEAEDDD